MIHKNEEMGCSFSLPERVTVRQQMTYWADLRANEGDPGTIRLWEAGRKLVQDWQCECMPDPAASLDDLYDPAVVQVIVWAATLIWRFMNGLENVPKK